jgi:hypothetical protein
MILGETLIFLRVETREEVFAYLKANLDDRYIFILFLYLILSHEILKLIFHNFNFYF